jgi:TolA-binding protein
VNASASTLSDESYELLAAFRAPEFVPQPGAPRTFQAAMAKYNMEDYAGAASALRSVAHAQPNLAAARFYLGVSLLLTGDRISGIEELRGVTDSGDSAYLERARFYLAKGLIAEHDIHRAQVQLENLIAQHGDLEKQAAALLGQIRQS